MLVCFRILSSAAPRRLCFVQILPVSRLTLARMRSEGYCSWVCLSVTLNLTSRVFVRLTKDTTYLTGNEGQKFLTVFSENAPLQS